MKNKISLDLDALTVESFEMGTDFHSMLGTVEGHLSPTCNTRAACSCGSACEGTCFNTCDTCDASCLGTCGTCAGQNTCGGSTCVGTCGEATCAASCYDTCGISCFDTCPPCPM
ncbi:MAG TPA: hypothetical protein VF092_24560 [Longimicrobium sp.]